MDVVNWTFGLQGSKYDNAVGIKIVKLTGDEKFSTYLTMIDPDKAVAAHYHKNGNEHYHIIKGRGQMTLTDMENGSTTTMPVGEQSSFVVPENTLHTLKNIGEQPLVLMFSCPESHLDRDRFVL